MREWLLFLLALILIDSLKAAEPVAAPTAKRVEIDKTRQVLQAYEGERLVFQIHVSTGKWDKSTPNGQFQAGEKQRMHYSRLFHNAPMPYSVLVLGNVFIHGFTSVPTRPASHGCIRLPMEGDNPAKRFYEWVDVGTPIEVTGHWEGR